MASFSSDRSPARRAGDFGSEFVVSAAFFVGQKRTKQAETAGQSVANVPIVFEHHEKDEYNLQAFLPLVIQDYRPDLEGRNNWYNMRVLYLNVTTVTEKVTDEDGEEHYVCRLDPTSDARLNCIEQSTCGNTTKNTSKAPRPSSRTAPSPPPASISAAGTSCPEGSLVLSRKLRPRIPTHALARAAGHQQAVFRAVA